MLLAISQLEIRSACLDILHDIFLNVSHISFFAISIKFDYYV